MDGFTASDGIRLGYCTDDFTDPWKEAPVLLLLHAAMGSARRYYAWVPPLSRHHRVVRRGEGKVQAIKVIFEIEDFGEAGAGVEVLVPVAVGALVIDEPVGRARDGGIMRVGGGEERHHAPGGLRCGGFALAFE